MRFNMSVKERTCVQEGGSRKKAEAGKLLSRLAFGPAFAGEANGRLCMKMVIALCFLPCNPIRAAAAGFPKMRQDDDVSIRRIRQIGAGAQGEREKVVGDCDGGGNFTFHEIRADRALTTSALTSRGGPPGAADVRSEEMCNKKQNENKKEQASVCG